MKARLLILTLHLFSRFSLPTVHKLAELLAKIFLRYLPQARLVHVTRVNLNLCFPQLTHEARQKLLKNSMIETVKSFTELGALWLWRPEKTLNLIKKVSGEALLQQARATGKPIILLTPHFGAWELTGLYAQTHYPMVALYRPPKILSLNEFILQARKRGGGHYVSIDRAGIRSLYETLRCGGIVGILPDQVPHDKNNQTFAPFFGVLAETMILVARLARKMDAMVIFTYAERLPHGQGFHLYFFPAPEHIDSPDLNLATQALNAGVEHCLQSHPEQYQWSYKRFKTRPAGEPDVYRNISTN
jgi:Kdo2-lipid IVA lauroyltransferase/acyltransferase